MTTFSQSSPSNDLYLDGNGQLAVSTGKEAYAVIIAAAIRTQLGELQLDEGEGIDYIGTVFADRRRIDVWRHYVSERIRRFSFVLSVGSIDAEVDKDGNLRYSVTVYTDGGEVTVEGGSS